MEKVIQHYGKRTKVFWTNADESSIVRALLDTRGNAFFVSHSADGFSLQSNEYDYPGLKTCNKMLHQRGKPICCEQAVWCTRHKTGPRSSSTGYYCDAHLDPELRPDGEQITLF